MGIGDIHNRVEVKIRKEFWAVTRFLSSLTALSGSDLGLAGLQASAGSAFP